MEDGAGTERATFTNVAVYVYTPGLCFACKYIDILHNVTLMFALCTLEESILDVPLCVTCEICLFVFMVRRRTTEEPRKPSFIS